MLKFPCALSESDLAAMQGTVVDFTAAGQPAVPEQPADAGQMIGEALLKSHSLSAKAYDAFADVLFQPESKRPQTLFLQDLARPQTSLCPDWARVKNDLLILRLPASNDESRYFSFNVPTNTKRQIVIVEADSCSPAAATTLSPDTRTAAAAATGKAATFIDISVERDAELNIVYVHAAHTATPHTAGICLYNARVATNAAFTWTAVDFTGSLQEFGRTELAEPYAKANINAAAFILNGHEQSYLTKIICARPHTTAHIFNRGVVEGKATGRMAAVCDIAKGASGTIARQENRFITLSPEAKAFADPSLLIDEYDVAASHLATVGQLDEESTYYLCSRGLSRSQAIRLVTVGFLIPVLDLIPQTALRDTLKSDLDSTVNEKRGDN